MPCCSVAVCKNTSGKVNYMKDGISFHTYPKDPKLKEMWINATGRRPNWFPTKTSTICSSHFEPKCFQPLEKIRRLFESSVPTLKLRMMLTDQPQILRCASPSGLSDIGSSDLEGALDTPTRTVLHLKKKLREKEEKLKEKDEQVRENAEKIDSLQKANNRLKEKNTTLKLLLAKMKRKMLILKRKTKHKSDDQDLE